MLTNKKRLIEEFKQLISIDSPSFGERNMADYLKEQLTGLGLTVHEDDAGSRLGGNSGNLYGFLEGDNRLQPILLGAHMDTVEPSAGKRTIEKDGILYSGGDTVLGADDCSGVAAILEALRVVREQKLSHRPIEILFTIAEEAYCKGAAQLDFSNILSKEAYVLDYSGPAGTAASQAPTILSFTAAVHGLASHAGFAPHKGKHAIRAVAEAIAQLPLGQTDFETTLNIGTIQGGRATNIVPDLCTVSGEIRSYSHEKALELADRVRKSFADSAAKIGGTSDFDQLICFHAYKTPQDHPVIERFQRICGTLGLPGTLKPTFGGSDSNVFAQHGITGLVVASAMYQCHSLDEYAPIDELVQLAELTRLLITDET